MIVNVNRIQILQKGVEGNGPIVYWMNRDQRVHDNWAILFAQETAILNNKPLVVFFNLTNDSDCISARQLKFMLHGLRLVEAELHNYNIPFVLLTGNPVIQIPEFLDEIKANLLVSDFNPLRKSIKLKKYIASNIKIPFLEVDAHNIVPCRLASKKQEYAAFTIRPKIDKYLPDFLEEFPEVQKMEKKNFIETNQNNWDYVFKSLIIDKTVNEINWIKPGEKAANQLLKNFIEEKLGEYEEFRNDPTADAQSNLSPHLHFGHISAQRVALEILKSGIRNKSTDSFLEELIIRKELSDNFCYYNKYYDSFNGFPDWAKETLNAHRKDEREFVYSLHQFESAETHEDLWNAAQKELLKTGKLHGYMRMYWAKKILEWSRSPEDALKISLYLNDKYELDGNDPNGYAGCAWAIGGVHDRPWFERPVYGKIRYMNRSGSDKKFDVKSYISKFSS